MCCEGLRTFPFFRTQFSKASPPRRRRFYLWPDWPLLCCVIKCSVMCVCTAKYFWFSIMFMFLTRIRMKKFENCEKSCFKGTFSNCNDERVFDYLPILFTDYGCTKYLNVCPNYYVNTAYSCNFIYENGKSCKMTHVSFNIRFSKAISNVYQHIHQHFTEISP